MALASEFSRLHSQLLRNLERASKLDVSKNLVNISFNLDHFSLAAVGTALTTRIVELHQI